MSDAIGDRMKFYERQSGMTELRLFPTLPAVARVDGKNFSSFTRGLARPYDIRLSKLMRHVTALLVTETNACIGYTQSDEITLVWGRDRPTYFGQQHTWQTTVDRLSSLSRIGSHHG